MPSRDKIGTCGRRAAYLLLTWGGLTSAAGPSPQGPNPATPATLVLENARVRVFKAASALALTVHPAAVVVCLSNDEAYWSGQPSPCPAGPLIIVEPKAPPLVQSPHPPDASEAPPAAPPPGFSFRPLFENDRVRVVRGRMEANAQEGFHTHGSDMVLVHLSGGTVEDTAEGRTRTNRWQRGDVEFEARGSSHSARNLGPAVEAIVVTVKP